MSAYCVCFTAWFAGYRQQEVTLQLVSLSVKFGFQLVTGFISEHRLEGDLQFCVVGRTPPSVFEIVDPIHETQNSVQTLLQKLSSNFFQTVIFLWACLHTDISPETLCQCETCLLSHSKVAILLKRKCFFFSVLVSVAHSLYIIAFNTH